MALMSIRNAPCIAFLFFRNENPAAIERSPGRVAPSEAGIGFIRTNARIEIMNVAVSIQ